MFLFLFTNLLSEVGIHFNEVAYKDGGGAADHRPHEEVAIADGLLEPAGTHAGEHHAEGHEACTDSVV